ncbi:MAG TPA: hypothetical protein PKW82_09105 [Spirochaetales bacterium]|nr:hypothetical protein [Spirochaetales bacterium]
MQDASSLMPIAIAALVLGTIIASFILSARSGRKKVDKARTLAEALGFRLAQGRDASEAALDTPEGERLRAGLERLPPFVRSLLDKAAGMRVQGELSGVRAAVWLETRSSGKSSSTWTVARAYLPAPLPFALRLTREGAMTRLGKTLFGLQDLELGDPDFDPKVRVKTADPAQARLALDADARRAALALFEAYPAAIVTSEYASRELQGVHLDPERVRPVLEALAKVAATLGR